MRPRFAFASLLLILYAIGGCDDGHLRGAVEPSDDGKTYFAIVDDNGGHCGPIKIDGEVWPLAIGQAGPIEPGNHTIECGAEISFSIPSGVVFEFDYWGP
jgi:hypothetical protein